MGLFALWQCDFCKNMYSISANPGIDKAFIVEDDIELGYLNTIRPWQFGLIY